MSSALPGFNDATMSVDHLPDELLSLIFEYAGLNMLHNDEPSSVWFSSQVSFRWSHIIHHTPSVWCYVPIYRRSNLNLPQLHFEKSRHYPLSIYLNVRARGANLVHALQCMVEQSERWYTLIIRVPDAPTLSTIISRLRRTCAPRSKHFELYVDAPQHTIGQLPEVFQDGFAQLTSLTLRGRAFNLRSPLLSRLRSLTLCHLPQLQGHPPHHTFQELLGASPKLEYLALDGVFPYLSLGIEYDEILVPALQVLDIRMQCQGWRQFISILKLPCLNRLTFTSSETSVWRSFESSLSILAANVGPLQELHLNVLSREPPFVDWS
ncbi:unnamed protein product [Somion occarium]|uniref:F-box domain-containing protein n=1 Tax=Somion occarium TaxID=3059160 RepID=A0ABP1CFF4_9APHY